ncbi:MAG: bifunctional (p)ppGpp synthetase/guanosine-3',5'-bis(diphosphate) 3'-pyrophosphohydrolase [Holosporaceae bacterium]|nr:bifunctional (p)ppGpp synthetase/guanosine-3',5'-bis(diphosphate) 3'-pyrophosphohydrolase [Holosporaceae bacterium]
MITSPKLAELVLSYDPNANIDLLRKAYMFSIQSHSLQKRASGSPFFYHPAEVAKLLTEFKLDVSAIITGLLHDVLEDTNVSLDELKEIFGSEIAFLVDGVTKLSRINYTSSKIHQAENFRKFLLATSKDIRVLLVKLMDRLHNIRTLNYISSIEKRKEIALETLEIYAPLAERIGMSLVKDEMEDAAFYNLHPTEYTFINRKLEQMKINDSEFITNTISELSRIFRDAGIDAEINGRGKKAYSIWKKMQKRNVNLEQINDIVAFRVIVKTVQQCYLSLGVIHTNFQIMPGKFKDYISIPKLNNYRSLHTTIIGPFSQRVEIQIRTEEMHRVADDGAAAHWSYKDSNVISDESMPKHYTLIKNLLTIIKNSNSPEDIIDNSKLGMFDNEVFCFTPLGDLIALPHGATVVDFAYEIHTNIGNTCIGGKINGKMVPIKTVLKNGDQVDIITSPYQHPETAWKKFVVTCKAMSCINKFIKSREKIEFQNLGLALTKYLFSKFNLEFSETVLDVKRFSCTTVQRFYYNLAKGNIPLHIVEMYVKNKSTDNITLPQEHVICVMNFTPGIAVHFAECCHPILGDKVISVLIPKKGLVVHVANCDTKELSAYSFVKVKWNNDDEVEVAFNAKLRIVIFNRSESFATVTNIISSSGANITNISVDHRSIDFFDLQVDIIINDPFHLGEIQAALRACGNVRSVHCL